MNSTSCEDGGVFREDVASFFYLALTGVIVLLVDMFMKVWTKFSGSRIACCHREIFSCVVDDRTAEEDRVGGTAMDVQAQASRQTASAVVVGARLVNNKHNSGIITPRQAEQVMEIAGGDLTLSSASPESWGTGRPTQNQRAARRRRRRRRRIRSVAAVDQLRVSTANLHDPGSSDTTETQTD